MHSAKNPTFISNNATHQNPNLMKKITLLASILLFVGALSHNVNAQAIDYAATAQIDTGVALTNGSPVPTGSLMAFGYYPTALSGPLTGVSSMSDILNPGGSNAFVTIFSGTMGLDDGAGGFYEGLFAAGVQSTSATPVGNQFYYIIGNNPISLSDATEAGVFTSSSWIIPSLGDPVPTLFANDISEVPRDSTGILFGAQGIGTPVTEGLVDPAAPNYNLQAVPEPSTYALLGLAGLALGGYAARRRRRA
jgi:hypothetical protein